MKRLEIIGGKILSSSDLEAMNNAEKVRALAAMSDIVDTLEKAADSLEIQAAKNGAINLLVPKIRMYAKKIKFLQS